MTGRGRGEEKVTTTRTKKNKTNSWTAAKLSIQRLRVRKKMADSMPRRQKYVKRRDRKKNS